MPRFDFKITLDSYVEELNEVEAVYARLDDVSLYSAHGHTHIGFHREAATLDDAIRSAIADLQTFGYSVTQISVEPECVRA